MILCDITVNVTNNLRAVESHGGGTLTMTVVSLENFMRLVIVVWWRFEDVGSFGWSCGALVMVLKWVGGGFGWIKVPQREVLNKYWKGLVVVQNSSGHQLCVLG